LGYYTGNIARIFLHWVFYFFERSILRQKIREITEDKIIFFDIDNTLANTRLFESDFGLIDFENLAPFKNICECVHILSKKNDIGLIFISARPKKTYSLTKKWLQKNVNPAGKLNIILVKSQMNKVKLLCDASKNKNVILVDDFSYGTKANTKFYYQEMSIMKKKSLIYLGSDFIDDNKKNSSDKISYSIINSMKIS
jgi:hypothetical protein